MIAQFVVQRPLRRLQLAEKRLLHFRRQITRHLGFGSPRMKGRRARESNARCSVVELCLPGPFPSLKTCCRSEHAGIQEFEQTPQFAQVIFDGRAAQRQPMAAAQEARGFRGFCGCEFLMACASSRIT